MAYSTIGMPLPSSETTMVPADDGDATAAEPDSIARQVSAKADRKRMGVRVMAWPWRAWMAVIQAAAWSCSMARQSNETGRRL